MGTLEPNATYVYERDGVMIYARKFGGDPSKRHVVGYDTTASTANKKYFSEWNEILIAAENNPVLMRAVEQCIMLYRLSKDYAS